jgi:hypothetical protein
MNVLNYNATIIIINIRNGTGTGNGKQRLAGAPHRVIIFIIIINVKHLINLVYQLWEYDIDIRLIFLFFQPFCGTYYILYQNPDKILSKSVISTTSVINLL